MKRKERERIGRTDGKGKEENRKEGQGKGTCRSKRKERERMGKMDGKGTEGNRKEGKGKEKES